MKKFRDKKTGVLCLTIRPAVLRFCGHNPCSDCPLFRFKNHGCHHWAEEHPAESARLMGYEVIEDSSSDSATDSSTGIDDTPTDTPTKLDNTPTEEVNMDKQDKPLSEWTLGECKRYCDEQSEYAGMYADTCQDTKGGCLLFEANVCEGNPSKWKLETAESAPAKDVDAPDKPRLAEVLGVVEDEKWHYPELFGSYRIHNGVREYWDENNGWLHCDCEEDLVKIIAHPEKIVYGPRLTESEIAIMRAVGAKWVTLDLKDGDDMVSLWDREPVRSDQGVYIWAPEAKDSYVGEARASLFPSVKPGNLIRLEEI